MTRGILTLVLLFGLAPSLADAIPRSAYDRRGIARHRPSKVVDTDWMSLAIELVENGSFESGGFAPWSTLDDSNFGDVWLVWDGADSPANDLPIPPPTDGQWQAVIDQLGPGTHILWQDVTIPPASAATLNLTYWYDNQALLWANTGDLESDGPPNQHLRIDVVDPAHPVDSNDGVLAQLFITEGDAPFQVGTTVLSADLSAFSGSTIRLRVAEVDNQFFLLVGIDAVSIDASPSTPVEASTWGAIKSMCEDAVGAR